MKMLEILKKTERFAPVESLRGDPGRNLPSARDGKGVVHSLLPFIGEFILGSWGFYLSAPGAQ